MPDDQLSLAIGNKGQNVRLAAKLTGWRIDIKPESEADAVSEDADTSKTAMAAAFAAAVSESGEIAPDDENKQINGENDGNNENRYETELI